MFHLCRDFLSLILWTDAEVRVEVWLIIEQRIVVS